MSWAYKITILYLGFVAIILSLVFTCLGETIELESKDYYAKELKFQDQIDAGTNALNLQEPIEHQVNGRSVELSIPAELRNKSVSGEVYFFRPSDSSLDKIIPLSADAAGKQVLTDASFAKGVYKMRISISGNGKKYYSESVINFK